VKLSHAISSDTFQDLVNIASGAFAPLKGFMTAFQYRSVLDSFQLAHGQPWPMPITLDVDKDTFAKAHRFSRLHLTREGHHAGVLEIEDCFSVNAREDCLKIFQTADPRHPGVCRELQRSPCRVGGRIVLAESECASGPGSPRQVKEVFAARGWRTVVGFQTRNPIHRAHEHLIRTALEVFDAVFINPISGWKKPGDFSDEAVRRGYQVMLETFLPAGRIHFEGLKTCMRYAGPREALFHALIRRNLGCTHFIIGRDHAGVGAYYGVYDAQQLARRMAARQPLGIELLLLKEPFHCLRCNQVVTESTCPHSATHKLEISGSIIRDNLRHRLRPDSRLMREEVADALLQLGPKMFVQENSP
jgi:sulfate adenylyltransferase